MKSYIIFFLVSLLSLSISSESAAQFEIGTDFATDYVWRGFDVLGGGPVVSPWIGYSFGESGLSGSIWTAWALTNRDSRATRNLDELDLTLSYERQISSLGLLAGVTYFAYPQMDGFPDEFSTNYEAFLGATLNEILFSPSLTLYYAFNEDSWDGLYAQLSAGHTIETETCPLDLSLSLGYSDQCLVAEAGISDINLSLGTSIETNSLSYAPKIVATFVPDDLIYPDSFMLWGMLSISWIQ